MFNYIPRYYQKDAVASLFDYFKHNYGNPIVAAPTGTGKSFIIADFMLQACTMYPSTKIMMLTHVKELVDNNHETLLHLWPTAPSGIYSAGLKRRDTDKNLTFGGIGSVVKNLEAFGKQDLIMIDECHLVSPKQTTMYRKLFKHFKDLNPLVKIIGFSATPYRTGVGLLTEGGLFTDICYDCTTLKEFNKLIEEGYIAPLIPKKTGFEFDASEIRSNSNDYVLKALQESVNKDELTRAAMKETVEAAYATGRQKWLIFASGIEHAEAISAILSEYGIDAPVVHSKMKEAERDRIILEYKNGKYFAIVNNGILTTGHDFPELDMIAVLRPTKSASLWVQMLGRGTRPLYTPGYDLTTKQGRLDSMAASQKQNCLVLDFGANTKRLGPINDPVLPKKKGERKQKGDAPVKVCEHCSTYNHASARFCVHCGQEFPKFLNIVETAATDELIADGKREVNWFDVTRVTAVLHRKQNSPDSMKVSYYCGLRRFSEYVCLEHTGFPQRKARKWWADRTGALVADEIPSTVDYALSLFNTLPVPRNIEVWTNTKYPEILNYSY